MTRRQFQGLPVSEAAVHRLSQAWHSVHTHCLCPLGEEAFRTAFGFCSSSLRRRCLKEAWGTACLPETSCPELQRPKESAGETPECAPESLKHQKICHIGGCTFFPSGTRQDFHRKSIRKRGWSFHNRNSSQEESTNCR